MSLDINSEYQEFPLFCAVLNKQALPYEAGSIAILKFKILKGSRSV